MTAYDIAAGLPTIGRLRQRCKALAVLERIFRGRPVRWVAVRRDRGRIQRSYQPLTEEEHLSLAERARSRPDGA
ncbi:hypothetical protein ABZ356_12635 [Micromonospora zamorensis]|uniref:hypothetical protein n=1 Tax=Micromonospora zamorensis TaxID=709883 RepID=UPI0033AC73FF